MKVTDIILEQLGGNKFLAMTLAKNLLADGNTMRMTLPKSRSKANRLYITLDPDDTYTMRFFKFTAGRLNMKTFAWIEDKIIKSTGAALLPRTSKKVRKIK